VLAADREEFLSAADVGVIAQAGMTGLELQAIDVRGIRVDVRAVVGVGHWGFDGVPP
jgi:hypothetical protein